MPAGAWIETIERAYMKRILGSLCLILLVMPSFAKQLTVEQIARYDEKEYFFIVEETVEVGPDDRLVLTSGLKVYFAPLVGIDVKGELIIDGKPHEPVILKSRRASLGSGAAHDWSGIKVFQGGSLIVNYGVISNASVGIKTCCDNVTLLNTSFYTNGAHFLVGDKRITVFDREPVNYVRVSDRITEVVKTEGVKEHKAADERDVAKKAVRTPPPAKVKSERDWGVWGDKKFLILTPIAVGCAVTGVVYAVKWGSSDKDVREYDPDKTGDSYSEATKKLGELESKRNLNAGLSLGFMAAGLGLGGYVVYYTFTY